MTKIATMEAETRTGTRKSYARALRMSGMIPAVIYGGDQDPQTIQIPQNVLEKEIHGGGFFTHLYDLTVDGEKQRVLARDVQFHPVKDLPQHVDFLRVTSRTKIKVDIPVTIVGQEESPGLEDGGVLNVVRFTVEVLCRADQIPEHLEASVAGLEVGDSLHISAVNLPDGVEPTITDRDFTIAQIAAPKVVEEPAPTEGEGEGEEGAEGDEAAAAGEGGDAEASAESGEGEASEGGDADKQE